MVDTVYLDEATAPSATTDALPTPVSIHAGNTWPQATGDNIYGVNTFLSGGIGQRFFTVVDFSALADKTVTISVENNDGQSSIVYTEGIEWTAETSNAVTAGNLATAIGASAEAVGAIVYITPPSTAHALALFTNAAPDLTATNIESGAVSTGQNTIIGQGTGTLQAGDDVTLYGNSAGRGNTGNGVVLLGGSAGAGNTSNNVVAIGSGPASLNAGNALIAIGSDAGQNNTGDDAIIIGDSPGGSNTGDNAIIIGANAGNSNAGDDAVIIGAGAGSGGNTFDNVVAIGSSATPLASNSVQLGNTSVVCGRIGAPTVVGSLPSAATVGAGARAFVTDANETWPADIGSPVTGGGGNSLPVLSHGGNWKVG